MAIPLIAAAARVILPAVLRVAPAAARALTAAVRPVGRYLAGNPTRIGMIAASAAPTLLTAGAAIAEYESGGALSDAAFDAAKASLEYAIEHRNIVSAETLESAVNAAGYVSAIMDSFDKAAQNQVVRAALGDDPAHPNIERGKAAAISWQLKPDNLARLATVNLLRASVVDKVIPNKDDADRYLAQNFIKDLVKHAHVRALGNNQVSEEDIKKEIKKIYNDPDSALTQQLRGSRLERGLLAMWPDLRQEAPAPAAPAASSSTRSLEQQIEQERTRVNGLRGSGLSMEFNKVSEENHLNIFSSFSMFMAKVLTYLGNPGGLADHFMRAVVIEETTEKLANQFNQRSQAQETPAPSNTSPQRPRNFSPGI